MPFGSVRLIPGVNTEKTPTLNEAGYSQGSLIRFRDSLAEKIGGWIRYYQNLLSGVPRDLHAWQDLSNVSHLAVGTTLQMYAITGGVAQIITPQILATSFAPKFSTTINLRTVTVDDSNINTVTTYDCVFFDTPVSVGGIILSGFYPIDLVTGATTYQITAATAATATVANGGAVPTFTTVASSSIVTVNLTAHGLSPGSIFAVQITTTGNGVMILGVYPVISTPTANTFTIDASTQANASSTFSMASGNARLTYYIALGPAPPGAGYGLGGYGLGGYGTGVTGTVQTGTPISAIDWTSDNWGEVLLACPKNSVPYYWSPNGGFATMRPIATAPPYNGGIFVSMAQQIVVAWASSIDERTNFPIGIGIHQDPMLVAWCAVSDFLDWDPTAINQAGNFRISNGSEIRGGMAVFNQNLIWTDLDLWAMNYIGPPDVFGFNKIGAGAGLCGSHAALQFRGRVYWMGSSNFFSFGGGSVEVMKCDVWDAVFQNLNTTYIKNVRAMPNTAFNEVGWLYPSLSSQNGECDSYAKVNINEPGKPWDYGALPRSAWIDQSVLGSPIAATPQGLIYQHESGYNADGQPLVWSFTTGYFMIAEGEDFPCIDQILPDMKWGTFAGAQTAQVLFTFSIVDYPGDTPRTFGPFPVTQSTQYIYSEMRGRQMSITLSGSDLNSFSRLGRVRYRWFPMGRA